MSGPVEPRDPERMLSLAYAAARDRGALAALWALDDALAASVQAGRDPNLRELRLTWWFEALERLDRTPAPDQPLLALIAAELLPRGVSGAALATMIDGWDVLLNPDPLSEGGMLAYAEGRGRLFTLAGAALGGGTVPLAAAGQGWALADLARHSTGSEAARAAALAAPLLGGALRPRWPRRLRALGMVAALAARDLARPDEARGAPRRIARMLLYKLTGR
ncbi:hypothetical protein [Sphingomonas sp.]|uniref:hypothetical protein n=1 Tax=Sphingomonas sp. TaxID=28214 RepID=UPI001DCD036C|nr:hypothetical protein [Sphingomonas sp.]MBX9795661.1 hypothetical protein [Sphingomonas sp.]